MRFPHLPGTRSRLWSLPAMLFPGWESRTAPSFPFRSDGNAEGVVGKLRPLDLIHRTRADQSGV